MITSRQFKDWLKPTISGVTSFYSGSLGDANLEKTITVYPYKGITAAMKRIDGVPGYRNQAFTLLLRWTRNSEESELKAYEVYMALQAYPEEVTMHSGIPVFLGMDDGIHEYVMNFNILHKEIN